MSTTADHAPTALSALIETADAVAATSSRKAKIDALAGLLRTLGPAEIEPAVGILTGELRQGSLASAGPPSAPPTLRRPRSPPSPSSRWTRP